jgi:hypothetical protein
VAGDRYFFSTSIVVDTETGTRPLVTQQSFNDKKSAADAGFGGGLALNPFLTGLA